MLGTVCTQCYVYHWSRNINIDIDKYRNDRIQQVAINPLNILSESQFTSQPITQDASSTVLVWLDIAKRLRRGEDWKESIEVSYLPTKQNKLNQIQICNFKINYNSFYICFWALTISTNVSWAPIIFGTEAIIPIPQTFCEP